MIKKSIGWLLSWTLYWLGDIACRIMDPFPIKEPWKWWLDIWWPLYQKFMSWSSNVQDWAGNETPWRHIEK